MRDGCQDRSLANGTPLCQCDALDCLQVKSRRFPEDLSVASFDESALELCHRGDKYSYFREITHELHLDPGVYVVVPSSYNRSHQADYLLRIYTESLADGGYAAAAAAARFTQYNTKFVKRHVAVASEALANRTVKKQRRRRTNVL